MPSYAVVPQRVIVCATLVLAYVVFWSGSADPINVVKLTLVVLGALGTAVVAVGRVAVMRRVALPHLPLLLALVAFMVAAVLSTVASDVPGASLAGEYGRNSGLLLYLSCAVLALATAQAFAAQDVRWVSRTLLGTGAFAASYGALQGAGIDAVAWADVGLSPIIGTVGNPNFQSAYLGIVLPLAAWGVLTLTWSTPWRAAAAGVGLVSLVVAVATGAAQGVLAGLAGLLVMLAAWLMGQQDPRRRAGLLMVAAVAVLGGFFVLLGLTGVGPLSGLNTSTSLTARRWYWSAALDMWRTQPVTGLGLDRFGAYYREFRTAEAAGAANYSDAAHSVPLHLLATGGALVALAYLAVVVVVLVALVRGLLRLEGEQRLLLGAVGGAWVAYQVQSTVSIDQVTLAVTHWVLAGCVVALAMPAGRERLLPGAVVPPPPGSSRRTPRPVTLEVHGPATVAAAAVAGVVALVLAYQALDPLRASHASRSGTAALLRGEGNAALDAMTSATQRRGSEDTYWLQRGRFLEQVGQVDAARDNYREGLQRDPRSYDLLLAAVAAAKKAGDTPAETRLTQQLRDVDPAAQVPTG